MLRTGVIAIAGLFAAGCTLISLEDLQSGAASSDGGGGGGPGSAGAGAGGPSGSSVGGSGTGAAGGSSGSGASAPSYVDCVQADSPSVFVRMTPGAATEPNLGALGGDATVQGFAAQGAPLVESGDGSRAFSDLQGATGSLELGVAPFPGGDGAVTLEAWFQAPSQWTPTTQYLVRAGVAPDTVSLVVEHRFDPTGQDAIRLVVADATGERRATYFLDLEDPPEQVHHVAAVYRHSASTSFDGGGASDDILLYVDGENVVDMGQGDPVGMAPIAAPMRLGLGVSGLVDEVAIYPVELEPARILGHFQLGATGAGCL